MIKKVGWSKAINDFVVKGHTATPPSIRQRLPTELIIKFNTASSLSASYDNEGSFILNLFDKVHEIFPLIMVDNVTIIQERANIQFI